MISFGRCGWAVAIPLTFFLLVSCGPTSQGPDTLTDNGASADEAPASSESTMSEQEVPADTELQAELAKPEIEDGHLYAANEKPPIESMEAFLDQYSDEELAQVTRLTLSANQITQLDGLDRLRNLQVLSLIDNQVLTLRGAELPSTLVSLSVNGNGLDSLDDIPTIQSLLGLSAERNRISSTEGLDRFPNLKSLALAYNPIEDFSGLLELTGMEYISFSYNREVVGDEILEIAEQIRANNPDAEIYW